MQDQGLPCANPPTTTTCIGCDRLRMQGAGYQVYVAQPLESDPAVCAKRSTHGRTLDDLLALAPLWEDTPATFPQLNLGPLLSPSQRVSWHGSSSQM